MRQLSEYMAMKESLGIFDLCGQMVDIIYKRHVSKREIEAFLKLLAINLHLARIYVFKYDPLRNIYQRIYGYNDDNLEASDMQFAAVDAVTALLPLFNKDGVMLVDCNNPFFEDVDYTFLKGRGRFVLAYRIDGGSHLETFIGMDIPAANEQRLPLAKRALVSCGRVMKIFLQQEKVKERESAIEQVMRDVINQSNLMVFIVDEHHNLVYFKDNIHQATATFEPGETCHEQMMMLGLPCANCILKELRGKKKGFVQREIYSLRYHQWFLVTCSIIERSSRCLYLFTAVESTSNHLDKAAGNNYISPQNHVLSTGDICSTLEYATKSYIFYIDRKTGRFHCSDAMKGFIFSEGDECTVEMLINAIYPTDRSRLEQIIAGGIADNRYYSYDLRVKMSNGYYMKMLLRGREVPMKTGENIFWGALISASRILDIDELTQLRNDRAFYQSIKNNIAAHHPFSILSIDINNFSIINYERSRCFGDRVLVKFANYLMRQTKKYRAESYRLLGDSFAVIFYQDDFLSVERFYHNIGGWLKSVYNLSMKGYFCHYPDDTEEYEDMLHLLDYLKIITKKYRKSTLISYTPATKVEFNRYVMLQNMLRRSINEGFKGFYLVYQPYLNVQENRLIGAEALSRYRSMDGEEVRPDEFISIIEKLNLMCTFGRWVIQEAIKAACKFNELYKGFVININISHAQLEDKQLFSYIVETAQKEGLPLSCIELEFTEHFLSKEYEYINEKIGEIKKKGVKIAMDDFGTGYSSLGFLKSIDVDIVKIDKIFLKDFLQDDVKKFFLECIINLCRKMNRRTILEGVEQGNEYVEIRRLGIDMVQGYCYSRPCTKEAVIDFIRTKKNN